MIKGVGEEGGDSNVEILGIKFAVLQRDEVSKREGSIVVNAENFLRNIGNGLKG